MMKKKFTQLFLLVAIVSTGAAFGQTCIPCEINSSWQHVKGVVIDNSTNPVALSNYQVLITLDTQTPILAGEMNSDGSDIRFTTQCTDNLFYWIETGINTAATQIWVKIPSIAANSMDTIYMYYGNPAAPIASNPDSTFDLYDGFNGSSLDLTKWEVRGTPTYSVGGGELVFNGNSNWEYIRSYASYSLPVIIEENHANAGTSFGFVLGYTGTDNRYTFRDNSGTLGCTQDPDVSGGNAWFNMTYPAVQTPNYPTYYDYRIIAGISGSAIQVQQYCNTTLANCNNAVTNLNSYSGTSFYVGFSSYSNGYVGRINSIRVRKYSAIVPTATLQNTFPLPSVNLGPDTAICANASIVLDAGNPGSTYVWNDLSTSQTLNASAAGNYIVTVTDANTCSNADTVYISNIAAPNVNLGSDTTICMGSNILLDAQNAGDTYVWNDLSTNQTLNVTAAGTYFVTVTNASLCTGGDTINITVNPLPVVDLGGDTTICGGNSIILDAQNPGAGYLWSNGSTTQTTSVSVPGDYGVGVTDAFGCQNTDTIYVNVFTIDNSTNTNSLTITSNAVFCTYQWIDCNNGNQPIAGETNMSYTATANGSYAVIIYQMGCIDTSACVTINSVGQENISQPILRIYPNPTTGSLFIDVISEGKYRITDILGQVVSIHQLYASISNPIDLHHLVPGIYFIDKIDDGAFSVKQKIVIGR